jgi:hypothetical protein
VTLVKKHVGEADMAEFSSFFAQHWGRDHILARDPAFARWQMPADACQMFADAALAGIGYFDGVRLVGFIGVMPMPFKVDGAVVPGAWLCNLLAAPETHDRGVGLKLMTSVHALPFQVVGAVGINRSVIPMYRAMRYMTGDRVPRFIRVLDPDRFAGLVDGTSWRKIGFVAPEGASPVVVSTVSDVPADWDVFWDRWSAAGYIGTHRNSSYMSWRYLRHPIFSYRMAVGRDHHGDLTGLAVWRHETIRDSQTIVTRFIELIARDDMSAHALARHVEDDARAHRAAFMDHYSTRPADEALRRCGWFAETDAPDDEIPCLFQPLARYRRDMNFAVRLLQRNGAAAGSIDHVVIAKSDGDQDRPN